MGPKWVGKAALITGLLLATLPAAEARGGGGGFRGGGGGFRGGGAVFVGPAYGYGYGPMWGGGWYGPYGYPGIYGGYGGYGVYNTHPESGQLKFDTRQKDAQVYINGALAGTVKDMKSTWLKQGDYDLEIRAMNGERYAAKIYISQGNTIKIRPQFSGDR